ncbi:hypothetical protein K450DRAFT_232715 [Umbelopsis ramanniana AG]|uniref:Uncharacterized protein n=1 Tax=Umbelopsis ramanniana AG TaxID=1314678 RepID=A0AAD5EDL1_UMBRA|nr:uncharacterized protein K450DRAFT_232715 [Umbelopsis ramanniana AG]KAI8581367.1 hypothetical protein K450DRAFT_232715 [Umbelopsis ramanniana AG]
MVLVYKLVICTNVKPRQLGVRTISLLSSFRHRIIPFFWLFAANKLLMPLVYIVRRGTRKPVSTTSERLMSNITALHLLTIFFFLQPLVRL